MPRTSIAFRAAAAHRRRVTLPQPVFWLLFAGVLTFMVVAFTFLMLRGEVLGRIECPCEFDAGFAKARAFLSDGVPHLVDGRLTFAREGGPAPKLQVRARLPAYGRMDRIPADQAVVIAGALDAAAAGDQEQRELGANEVGRAFELGRAWVRFTIIDKSDNSTKKIHAHLTASQAKLVAQWMRTAATPGRTVADARRRSIKASA